MSRILATAPNAAPRLYVKGERRFKHVSSTNRPEFVFERGNPKRVVGKCPNNIPLALCQQLLLEAVPSSNGDRSIDAPKRLYAFHDGVVYECRTSDHGTSYHAFPLRGSMPRQIADQLRTSLRTVLERCALDDWLSNNIRLEG